jgi:cobaltochelatase CobS
MKTDPTWKDVDEIVNLRTVESTKVSLAELETALASDDESKVKVILAALRGPTAEHEADVYPFGGVRLTLDIQRRRVKKWYDDKQLVTTLYTQALARAKEKRTAEEAIEAASSTSASPSASPSRGRGRPRKVGEEVVEGAEEPFKAKAPSKPRKPRKPKSSEIRSKIKFDMLTKNDDLMPYVPAVDENYVYPSWTLEFVKMVDHGINCWLYGGTGAGKSSLVEQICATAQLPLMYQSFHEDLKPDQLKGSMTLVDGNTVWQDGPVTKAYREGFVLLLDEFDAFPPEVQFCLFGVLDRKPLILEENGNEVVQPHPNFRIAVTGNTQGRGDESGMYAGTNILNRALLNRIGPWFKVDYPSEKIYREIIIKEGVREDVAKVVARLAKEINAAADNGTLTETFSLRDARRISVVAELCDGDINRALQLCLLNRLSSVEKGAVTELFRRLVPDDM